MARTKDRNLALLFLITKLNVLIAERQNFIENRVLGDNHNIAQKNGGYRMMDINAFLSFKILTIAPL